MDSYPVSVAGAITSCVRVIFLRIYATVLDDELKAVVHEATIAALVVGPITVHQLLLRQDFQISGYDLVHSFDSGDC